MAKTLKEYIENIEVNPTKVEFPRDQWGITSDFKKAAFNMAGRIQGDKNKFDAAIAALTIIAAHIKSRFDHDVVYQEYRREQHRLAEARPERGSYYSGSSLEAKVDAVDQNATT